MKNSSECRRGVNFKFRDSERGNSALTELTAKVSVRLRSRPRKSNDGSDPNEKEKRRKKKENEKSGMASAEISCRGLLNCFGERQRRRKDICTTRNNDNRRRGSRIFSEVGWFVRNKDPPSSKTRESLLRRVAAEAAAGRGGVID